MCNCGKVQSVSAVFTPQPQVARVYNCTTTKEKLLDLYTKLEYIKQEFSSKFTNIYMGKILTMLNLSDYCKYTIEEIELFINQDKFK